MLTRISHTLSENQSQSTERQLSARLCEKYGLTARKIVFLGCCMTQIFCPMVFANPSKVEAKEAVVLKRILEYWKEGHFADAKVQLRTYLSAYPQSLYRSEVYAMLGDLYLQEKDLHKALECYQNVQPETIHESTALHYAETLYQLGRYDELVKWTDEKKGDLFLHQRIHLLLGDVYYKKALQEENVEAARLYVNRALEEFSLVPSLDNEWAIVVAYLTALKGDKIEAAERYIGIANQFPARKSELLFEAALLLDEYDPVRAILLMRAIGKEPGKLQKEAIFNELCLLFREKKYTEMLQRKEEVDSLIEQDPSSLLRFYLGYANYELGQLDKAAEYFQTFIESSNSAKEEMRSALRALVFCGFSAKRSDLIHLALEHWQKKLPLDEDYLEALGSLASCYLNDKHFEKAKEILGEIVEQYPSHPIHNKALLEYARTLLVLNEFSRAKGMFEAYLATYSTSSYAAEAWKNLLFSSEQILSGSSKENASGLRQELIANLRRALEHVSLFDEELVRTYQLHLTHLLFQEGAFEEALEVARSYLSLYENHETANDVRLVQISCLTMLDMPVSSLVQPLQEALQKETDVDQQARLHLRLFNAYLVQESYDAALEHLFAVYKQGAIPIKIENLLWLGDLLHKKKDFVSAKEVFETILAQREELEAPAYEEVCLKLKNLYVEAQELEKARLLLFQLAERQKQEERAAWKFMRKTRYELAELCDLLGDVENAFKFCDELIENLSFSQASYYPKAAAFKKAQLQLKALSPEKKYEGSPELLMILNSLKDLEITRSVESEPTHLEAALEYAAVRSSLVSEQEKAGRMLFYLERIKEEFLSDSSELAFAYLSDRHRFPEQDLLIEHYLQYISAECKILQGQGAKQRGDMELFLTLKNSAREDLLDLQKVVDSSSMTLQKRVHDSLKLLD